MKWISSGDQESNQSDEERPPYTYDNSTETNKLTTYNKKLPHNFLVFFCTELNLILATAFGGRPKPEICFLPGRTLVPKERYGNFR